MTALSEHSIGFIGAGNMAEALIRGLVRGGHVPPAQIHASGPRAERIDEVAAGYGVTVTTDNREVARAAQILVLAVKPQILEKVAREIAGDVHPGVLVISVAAGIDTAILESLFPAMRVIRSMPNTPALVGAGATAISGGQHATPADLQLAKQLFDAVGMTVILDEGQLDAVTGLSRLGPGLHLPHPRGPGRRRGQGRAVAAQRPAAGRPDRDGLGQAPARHRRAPRQAQGHGDVAGRHRDRRAAHPRGGRPAHDPHQRGRDRHQAVARARPRGEADDMTAAGVGADLPARDDGDGIAFDVLVTPRASRARLGPVHGDRIKVAVCAPPLDGEANAAVIELVAKALGVPRSAVSIEAGAASRRKTVKVLGADRARLARAVAP